MRTPRRLLAATALACLAPLVALNLAVSFFGQTVVFPLSPRHLKAKAQALATYGRHRAVCVFTGHEELSPIISRVARRHRLDPHLLAALVEVESGTRPHRISPAGAMGPAQLIPSTARMLGVTDPFDPETGIDGGARYLRSMLTRFKNNEALALAGYNAGPGAVRGGRVPRNGETEHYVDRVLSSAHRRRATAGTR